MATWTFTLWFRRKKKGIRLPCETSWAVVPFTALLKANAVDSVLSSLGGSQDGTSNIRGLGFAGESQPGSQAAPDSPPEVCVEGRIGPPKKPRDLYQSCLTSNELQYHSLGARLHFPGGMINTDGEI
jgi:hypothetical protein